eukprot:ctg_483.g139
MRPSRRPASRRLALPSPRHSIRVTRPRRKRQPGGTAAVVGRAGERDTGDVAQLTRQRGAVLHLVCGRASPVDRDAVHLRHANGAHLAHAVSAGSGRRVGHSVHIARGAQGAQLFSPQQADPPQPQGRQHPPDDRRTRVAHRLHLSGADAGERGVEAVAPDVCGHTVLDGAGGDGAGVRLRLQGGRVVVGHHRVGTGAGAGSVRAVCADEDTAADVAGPIADAGASRTVQQRLQGADRRVSSTRAGAAADHRRAAATSVLPVGATDRSVRRGRHAASHAAARTAASVGARAPQVDARWARVSDSAQRSRSAVAGRDGMGSRRASAGGVVEGVVHIAAAAAVVV